jgi:hypothetical protein
MKARPFHDIASAAATTSEGTSTTRGADTSAAERATAAVIAKPSRRSGPIRA